MRKSDLFHHRDCSFAQLLPFLVVPLVVVLHRQQAFVVTAELKQVHIVTRHGAKYPLTRDPNSEKVNTVEALSSSGMQSSYQLGAWLQQRYRTTLSSTPLIKSYDPTEVLIESSRYGPTVVTANSIVSGLFGNVFNKDVLVADAPVYTTPSKDDITIRAFDKCPVYEKLLDTDLYSSKKWLQLEKTNKKFLQYLANITSFVQYVDNSTETIPLEQLWKVYESIQMAKEGCPTGEKGDDCSPNVEPELVNVLNDTEWDTLCTIVHKTEMWRYNSDNAGKYIGRNIVNQILARMKNYNTSDTTIETGSGKFYLYSAYYETLLAILAALGKNPFNEKEVVPSYTSALILEYYVNDTDGTDEVLVWYRRGSVVDTTSRNQTTNYNPVYLIPDLCENTNNTETAESNITSNNSTMGNKTSTNNFRICSLQQLNKKLEGWTIEQWCTECENDSADMCIQDKMNAAASITTESSSTRTWEFYVGWGLFIVLAVLDVVVVVMIIVVLVLRKQQGDPMTSDDTNNTSSNNSISTHYKETETTEKGEKDVTNHVSLQRTEFSDDDMASWITDGEKYDIDFW